MSIRIRQHEEEINNQLRKINHYIAKCKAISVEQDEAIAMECRDILEYERKERNKYPSGHSSKSLKKRENAIRRELRKQFEREFEQDRLITSSKDQRVADTVILRNN